MKQPRYGDIFAGHDEGAAMAENAKVLWAEYSAQLDARGLMTPPRARTLDRLVRATVEYQMLYPAAVAVGPVNRSENGGEYANMVWYTVWKLSDQISRLEKALTLTPESIGDKSEPDTGRDHPAAADEFLKLN